MTQATFAEACGAIEDVLPQFTDMLRSNRGVTATAVGSWTLPEVACHVSHVIEKDTELLGSACQAGNTVRWTLPD